MDHVPSLPEPPPHTELFEFPYKNRAGIEMWRICRAKYVDNPWFFASTDDGRFNLIEPYGTCYWAEDPIGAALETFLRGSATGGVVSEDFVASRRLVRTQCPSKQMADLNNRLARRYHVTLELCALPPPYGLTRRWATAFHAAGFDGIRWSLRHDPAATRGLAFFGRAGHDDTPATTVRVQSFNRYWRERLEKEGYIEIAPVPSINDLTIAEG